MAFAQETPRNAAMRDINITPLVDVMLVLLIIFMLATPLLTRTLPLDLPRGNPNAAPPDTQRLRVDASGALFWNDAPLPSAALPGTLAVEAARTPQPVLEITADADAPYDRVATLLAAAKRAGLAKIGMSDPG